MRRREDERCGSVNAVSWANVAFQPGAEASCSRRSIARSPGCRTATAVSATTSSCRDPRHRLESDGALAYHRRSVRLSISTTHAREDQPCASDTAFRAGTCWRCRRRPAAWRWAMRGASAQAEKKIEQLDPALDKIISTSEPIKELADGLRRHRWGRPKARCGGRRAAICCSPTFTTTGA